MHKKGVKIFNFLMTKIKKMNVFQAHRINIAEEISDLTDEES